MSNVRGKRATLKQKLILLDFLEGNPDFAHERYEGTEGLVSLRTKWMDLALCLNSAGGANKTVEQWKQYWRDLRRNVKAKAAEIRRQQEQPGTNSKISQLDNVEERIVGMTMVDMVDEDGSNHEQDFTATQTLSSTVDSSIDAVARVPSTTVTALNTSATVPSTTDDILGTSTAIPNTSNAVLDIPAAVPSASGAVLNAPASSLSNPAVLANKPIDPGRRPAKRRRQEAVEERALLERFLDMEERKLEIEEKKVKLMEEGIRLLVCAFFRP